MNRRRNTVFYEDDGGFRATHENDDPGEVIYYLGIIDCLTHVGIPLQNSSTTPLLTLNSTDLSREWRISGEVFRNPRTRFQPSRLKGMVIDFSGLSRDM